MQSKMTSRERVLAAMRRQEVDYVPCLPLFNPLLERQRVGYRWQFPWGPSQREQCEYLVNVLGVDAFLEVPIRAINPSPGVTSRVWMDGDVMHKVWRTPSGDLHAAITYDEKWPHGFDIPIFSDFLLGHCVTHWIESAQDIECLRHIIRPPESDDALARLRFDFAQARRIADAMQLPVITDIGMGLTGGMQLIGSTEICMMTVEQPDLLHEWLALEHEVNLRSIEIAADLGVDIVVRDGFYETCDFYSPEMLEGFLGEPLRAEGRAARQAGLVTAYTINTGLAPMLDYLATLEFDCFRCIDVAFKDFDLAALRDSQGDKRSYWIGPSSVYHVWKDDPELTRAAVRQCFAVLGKRGLLITTCPSAHSIMPWQNTLAMIDEWKKLR